MRLELRFEMKEKFMTLDDRACIMSFLKFALSSRYPEIYQAIYGENCSKSFCFSTFLPGAKFSGDRYILLEPYISVKISSSDNQLLMALYNSLMSARFNDYKLPLSNEFKLVRLSYSNTHPVKSDRAVIKFLSPLVVRNHDRESNRDIYLDYTSDIFSEKLQIITQSYLTQRGFHECDAKLTPVKAFRTVATCLGLKINCSYGIFEISAAPEVIEELYLAGMGSRRSQGFGMFDIIRQEV